MHPTFRTPVISVLATGAVGFAALFLGVIYPLVLTRGFTGSTPEMGGVTH